MRDDESETYTGPFVVMSDDADGFHVSVEPPPTGCEPCILTFASKDEAWRAARDLWTAGKLPFRDLTVGNTARWVD